MNSPAIIHYVLSPPYINFGRLSRGLLLPRVPLKTGDLIALRPGPDTPGEAIAEEFVRLRRGLPRATVILWLDRLSSSKALILAANLGRLGARGFVTGHVADPVALRSQLAAQVDLAGDVVNWLVLQGHSLNDTAEQMTCAAIQSAMGCRTLSELAARNGADIARWRRAIQQAGLPGCRAWFHIVRLLALSVHLQRDPNLTVARLAEQYRFWDDAALRRRLGDVLGAPPSVIRAHLGWEWLLSQAIRRSVPRERR